MSLPDLESGKAGGVVTAIEDSFKEIEAYDQLTEKIVAFGADGASVNQGKHGGAIAELRKKIGDWIIYIWCVSHRLELTLKDALKGTPFDDIDQMLLQMYYLYERSPKKIRELQEIYDKYKDILEFDEGGLKPLRASGTRWIAYKVEATKLVLDKYGLFINHLKQMSVDRSYTSTDRAKFIAWLRKWQDARYPLLTCLFIEVLNPSKVLSLAFQEEDTDIVSVVAAIEKNEKAIEKISRQKFRGIAYGKEFPGQNCFV